MQLHDAILEATQISNLRIVDIEAYGGTGNVPRLRGKIGEDQIVMDAGDVWIVEMPNTALSPVEAKRLDSALALLATGFRAEYERALARFENFRSLIESETDPFTEEGYGGSFTAATDEDPAAGDHDVEAVTDEELLDQLSKYRCTKIRKLPLHEAIPTLATYLEVGMFSPKEAYDWLTHLNYCLRDGKLLRGRKVNVHMAIRKAFDRGILEKDSRAVYWVTSPSKWVFQTAND